jgi:hypothetical protein
LTVDHLGAVFAEDARTATTAAFDLSVDEVRLLEMLIEAASIARQEPRQVRDCADCFEYELTLSIDSRLHTIRANSAGIDARLVPLVAFLTNELLGRLVR